MPFVHIAQGRQSTPPLLEDTLQQSHASASHADKPDGNLLAGRGGLRLPHRLSAQQQNWPSAKRRILEKTAAIPQGPATLHGNLLLIKFDSVLRQKNFPVSTCSLLERQWLVNRNLEPDFFPSAQR